MTKKKPAKNKSAREAATRGIPFSAIFLLFTAGMLLVLGVRVHAGQILHVSDLLPYGLWVVSALLLVGLLRVGGYTGPRDLPGLILLLSAVGVLVRSRMEGSVEEVNSWRHLVQPLGFFWLWLAWIFSRQGRVNRLRWLWLPSFLLSLGVLVGLILLGSRFRGAFYGPGGLTPSELLKILVPLSLAGFFAGHAERWQGRACWCPPVLQSFLLLCGWGLLCGLLILQRDLGLLLLLSVTLVVMLIAVTRSWSWGVLFIAAAGGGGWLVMQYMDHGARRLQAWMDPFADPTGSGWQVLQGLTGLYAGGLTGTGLGAGRPDRLPIAGSDFVYAVYGEELGYAGCLLLLLLFGLLIRRAGWVANLQEPGFSGWLASGLVAVLSIQVVVNIAGVVTLLPVTGITLPYISQGGSSLWVTSLLFGLLMGMAEPDYSQRARGGGRKPK